MNKDDKNNNGDFSVEIYSESLDDSEIIKENIHKEENAIGKYIVKKLLLINILNEKLNSFIKQKYTYFKCFSQYYIFNFE